MTKEDLIESGTLGFEEILSLQDKNRVEKYNGSYEQVAKTIYQFCTHKKKALKQYFKIVAMSYLLKNGDAHLKNFGLLFKEDFSKIWLSPAYDIVNTTCYIYKDKPALNMFGKKVWFGQKELIEFGVKNCMLSKNEADRFYEECVGAVEFIIDEIYEYIDKNPSFKQVGKRMIESFKISLHGKTIKELPNELTRAW